MKNVATHSLAWNLEFRSGALEPAVALLHPAILN